VSVSANELLQEGPSAPASRPSVEADKWKSDKGVRKNLSSWRVELDVGKVVCQMLRDPPAQDAAGHPPAWWVGLDDDPDDRFRTVKVKWIRGSKTILVLVPSMFKKAADHQVSKSQYPITVPSMAAKPRGNKPSWEQGVEGYYDGLEKREELLEYLTNLQGFPEPLKHDFLDRRTNRKAAMDEKPMPSHFPCSKRPRLADAEKPASPVAQQGAEAATAVSASSAATELEAAEAALAPGSFESGMMEQVRGRIESAMKEDLYLVQNTASYWDLRELTQLCVEAETAQREKRGADMIKAMGLALNSRQWSAVGDRLAMITARAGQKHAEEQHAQLLQVPCFRIPALSKLPQP